MDLKRQLGTDDFAILAEIEPPKGTDITAMVTNAAKVKEEVTAFMVPEMSNAVMRMSSLGAAMILQSKRMETVMQVNCRDRNRIALQADLLAAAAFGINNVMAVTGEDPGFGDHHQASAVYDIDINELLTTIQSLNNGKDMAGIELSGSPDFTVGAMVNSGLQGTALEKEIDEMKRKMDQGACFFITPPLFDVSAIEPFMAKVNTSGIHIIPTVVLLKSLGMARYMARNMKNVYIPDGLVKQIQKSPDKVRECIRIAKNMVSAIKENKFSGVMISTIGWEDKLYDIIHGI